MSSKERVRVDPVELAMETFTKIRNEIGDNEELGSKLRARAREGPELIRSLGLIPVLSFYYAKARDALLGGGGEEEKAYLLYFKAILLYLERLGLVKGVSDVFDLQSKLQNASGASSERKELEKKLRNEIHERVINILQDLINRSFIASRLLTPYLIEFKRLCEAVWERERR